MEKLESCPVCNHSTVITRLSVKDHSVSQDTFQLSKCTHCGFCFTNPRPSQPESDRYYDSDDYISHSNTRRGLINQLYQLVRSYSIRRKGELVKQHTKPGKLLDYGCGTGEFLAHMHSRGFLPTGIEPSVQAREQSIMNHSLHVVASISDLSPQEQFETITLWHVLEHIHDLRKTLKWLYAALKPGGKLIIAVPNLESFDSRFYSVDWAALDVPRHLYHFREQDVITLLDQHGFNFIERKPMWFDSFYISMLSEKYRGHGTIISLTKGLLIGLLSNIQAIASNNTSSKIYVFEKVAV